MMVLGLTRGCPLRVGPSFLGVFRSTVLRLLIRRQFWAKMTFSLVDWLSFVRVVRTLRCLS